MTLGINREYTPTTKSVEHPLARATRKAQAAEKSPNTTKTIVAVNKEIKKKKVKKNG